MQIQFGFISVGTLAVLLLVNGCSKSNSVPPNSASGTIETDEVRVASRYGGRVEKILVAEGDVLKTGQEMVELEAQELRARHDLFQAQLAELNAGPRKEEMEAAKHDWEALVTALEQANTDAKRAADLFAQKTVPETEREQTATRVRTLEKNAAAAKSRYDLLLAGTRPERLDQARAQLAEIDAQLREMKVSSPSDSVLEVLSVKVGDVLAPNQELATLLLTNHLWVRVYVPEPWLGHIKLGEAAKVRVDSEPGKDYSGNIEQIARAAEFTDGGRAHQTSFRREGSPG